MVSEEEPESMRSIKPILQGRREVVLARIRRHEPALREDFAALEVLNYRRTFDECLGIVSKVLA
jgi:hypothetical protein